jgi:hypothetical protein
VTKPSEVDVRLVAFSMGLTLGVGACVALAALGGFFHWICS